jgi:glycosyltransferase involved in cell wall biosynthesis
MATYEALAHGLPVVCTRNAGSVITDGVEGFIVESGNTVQMMERLERLAFDRALLAVMRQRARVTAARYSPDQYVTAMGQGLLSIV